jgi:CheY-like chemotaxis protein
VGALAEVLVADDDPIMRALLHEILTQAGHEVVEAEDGRAALRLAETRSFDLVVTDMLMPDMDGIELIQALRTSRPSLRILAISGGGRFKAENVLRWGAAVGADAVMTKPIAAKALLEMVERLRSAPGG